MIEIKEGWNADEMNKQLTVKDHQRQIKRYQEKIASSEAMLHQLRLSCTHKHVRFVGNDTFCDICDSRLFV